MYTKTVTFPNNRNESNKNVLHLRHFPTELFNCYTVTHRSTTVFTKHCSYKVLKNSLATNNVNNGKFPSLLCRHYSIEAHYAVSFVLLFPSKGNKGRQHMRSPRNVCAGGYGLNHSCPYNYLLLKMPIILFYKSDCKAGTTIKIPLILFYKTDC